MVTFAPFLFLVGMRSKHIIQFEGLSLGDHEFDFDIDKSLFDETEIKEILDTKVEVKVYLRKSENMMNLDILFKGHIALPCDRCDEEMKIQIDDEAKLVVKYGQVENENLDDLIILKDHEHEIQLGDYFYENLSLMIPQRNVHDESECDQEVIKMLKDTNNKIENESTDPRWEKLKNL